MAGDSPSTSGTMERKRKLPARASARVEAVTKRRTSTPPEQPAQPSPTPAPVVDEPLPKAVVAGKPLPTVEQPQSDDLPMTEYQSIQESGVMAESLERSRKKWLSEGIFEKYWTKPAGKKKNAPQVELNNPPKESMVKIGPCVITIEPHVFDVVMYAVKDTTSKPAPLPPPQPLYRPIIQYGPPNGVMPPPAPPTPKPEPVALPTPPSPQALAPQQQPPAIAPGPPSMNPALLVNGNASHANGHIPPGPNTNRIGNPAHYGPPSAIASGPQTVPLHISPAAPAPPPASKSSDPVIQMLAERASTDPDLKALMRVVADGKATPQELKRFQGHIDDLSKMLQAREAAKPPQQQQPPSPNNAPPMPSHIQQQLASAPPQFSRTQQAPSPIAPIPAPIPQTLPPRAQPPPPQPQALRSKGPPPASKSDISAVCFEFVGGSGDRFLFPKFSIIDYMPGNVVIASFLIVRKGSSADSKKYDPALDYYQPVTIRIYAPQGQRPLETLAKVVAHPDEVRRYMDDIMDNMTRAEYVLLAMQLPREGDTASLRPAADVEMKDGLPDNGVLWTATANGAPAEHVSSAKVQQSDEQQYQSFISTVV